MEFKRRFLRAVLLSAVLIFAAAFTTGPLLADEAGASKEEAVEAGNGMMPAAIAWEEEAEAAFNLKKGLAAKLLQKEEWEEHRERMEEMTDEERAFHVKDIHRSLMRRAKLQGIRVPRD